LGTRRRTLKAAIDYYNHIIVATKTVRSFIGMSCLQKSKLAAINAELAKPKDHFYKLKTLDQLDWLLDHPVYREEAQRINVRAAERRKRQQQDERESIPEFESLQFQDLRT
jgi:hypothetical protein